MMINSQTAKPLLIFGTRHGTIFNLTPSHLPEIPAIQLSVGDFYDFKDTLINLPEGMTLKKFLGFKENMKIYLSPYDFYKKQCINGCEDSNFVKIKCNQGYTKFSAEKYDEMASIIKPDILVTLTEYPNLNKGHTSESNKSHKRAINKTTNYLEKSLLMKNPILNCVKMAAVHGGKNLSLLSRSLEQILNFQVDGLLLCDLCDTQSLEEREEIFKTVRERINSEEKKQFVFGLAGLGKIEDIEHARTFGYSIFEVNYPFLLAQKEKALIKVGEKYIEQVPVKSESLKPLDVNCKCYSCLRHSESYIAHLIECFEMNAKVLLSIHNLQVYVDYLAAFD